MATFEEAEIPLDTGSPPFTLTGFVPPAPPAPGPDMGPPAPRPGGGSVPPQVPGPRHARATLAELVAEIIGPDDECYIRLTSGNDGKSLYAVAMFRYGRWRGHYVMSVVEFWQLDYGITLLADKVDAVRAGAREPSPDRYYLRNSRQPR